MNRTRQRFAMGAMVLAAVLAITIGAVYQDEDRLDDVSVVGGDASAPVSTAPGGAAGGGAVAPGDAAAGPSGPIEAFLPRSGEASACSEAVGVDLIPGYGAELTINGIEITPEQMNVNLDENGEITDVITASRSLGQYTFQPDDNCPNGSLLRPVDNVLAVCVYRLSDPTRRCTVQLENVFDAL